MQLFTCNNIHCKAFNLDDLLKANSFGFRLEHFTGYYDLYLS